MLWPSAPHLLNPWFVGLEGARKATMGDSWPHTPHTAAKHSLLSALQVRAIAGGAFEVSLLHRQ